MHMCDLVFTEYFENLSLENTLGMYVYNPAGSLIPAKRSPLAAGMTAHCSTEEIASK
jgi:hypothetical protein